MPQPEVAVKKAEGAWTIEARIPLEKGEFLNLPDPGTWIGFNICRSVKPTQNRAKENSTWCGDFNKPAEFGRIRWD
ncbi:MAG: hypothetical protein ABIA63_01515 [bacterium]